MTVIFNRASKGDSVYVGDTDEPLTDHDRRQRELRAVQEEAAARVRLTARRLDSPVGAFGQLEGRHRRPVR